MSEYVSINLNTKFANNYNANGYLSEPVWLIPQAIGDISAVKLKNFTCPLSVYTIDSRNNKLQFVERANTAASCLITLPYSNYNGISIASQLQTLMNSAGSYTYSVAYNTSGSNTLTISNTSGSFAFTSIDNNADYELGLESGLGSSSTSKTSDTIDLSGVNAVHLVSNIGGVDVINQDFKILGTVPPTKMILASE